MIVFVVGCAALGLGLGYLLNSNSPGSSQSASRQTATTVSPTTATTARVLGAQATRPTLPLPVAAPTTTTTTARPAPTTTTTAARATAAAAKPKSTNTTRPATAKKPAADCGSGATTASVGGSNGHDVVAGIENKNTKAIVIDAFSVRLVYEDGTQHTITVPGAAGTKVNAATADTPGTVSFAVNDPDAPNSALSTGTHVEAFAFHVDGQPACATS